MVMPERLPTPLNSSSEVSASTSSVRRVVAAPLATSSGFTALPKRSSFKTKYKLQILAETDRALDTGGISAIPEALSMLPQEDPRVKRARLSVAQGYGFGLVPDGDVSHPVEPAAANDGPHSI